MSNGVICLASGHVTGSVSLAKDAESRGVGKDSAPFLLELGCYWLIFQFVRSQFSHSSAFLLFALLLSSAGEPFPLPASELRVEGKTLE